MKTYFLVFVLRHRDDTFDPIPYEPIRKIFPRVRHTKVEPLRVFVRV